MWFEWDEAKNKANHRKHGIDFETAAKVFDDPNFVLIKDRIDEETGEQRWQALGVPSLDQEVILLLVAHVYRSEDDDEEIIRIISARKAEELECRLYLQ